MTREEKRGYCKGYNAGSKKAWPDHRPPFPREPILKELCAAAKELRDAAEILCATFPDDDPIQSDLGPKIDRLDEAFCEMSKWIRQIPDDEIKR